MKKRSILVTTALPYANGPLHLGHVLGFIQADIWVRYQRLRGHECHFVSGSDAHGTPIMLHAEKRGMSPEALVTEIHKQHAQDFQDCEVHFDNFYTTHSPENQELATYIYTQLQKNNYISTRTIEQAFDPVKNIFLPDRYVRGECPRCGAKDQYGDSCEVCGATYSPLELKNPVSALSGTTPISKQSEHYFFDLPAFEKMLKEWTKTESLQSEIANKLDEWFQAGLQQWDISRDAPYFGFEIPNHPGKYFYVWLDAPVGYIASFKNYCDKNGLNYLDFWKKDSSAELYHFIGKDIVYFHALFWPAMLEGAGFRKPTSIFANGFLTINGQKMSKSRGTFVTLRDYLNHLPPNYLRYYFAAKLNDRVEDIDLNADDFVARVNADLVGKLVNIASRCAGFINKLFNNQLSSTLDNKELVNEFIREQDEIAQAYENRQFARVTRSIMQLADKANQYIDANKPWQLAKDTNNLAQVQQICTTGLNLFRILMIYIQPIVPSLAKATEKFLQVNEMQWSDLNTPLLDHTIATFTPLLERLDKEKVAAMFTTTPVTETTTISSDSALQKNPLKAEISVDDFAKIDLRIVKIVDAQAVEGADKLVQLTVDLGGETRTIFAGIKSAFTPEELKGRYTVIVANLAPRKMRFGVSEGMVIVAGNGDGDLWLLSPEEGAQPGMMVK
jgi:methionyl-tRNA synthetase